MSSHLNVEIKARCTDRDAVRRTLLANGAQFYGLDRQVDTYFVVRNGRLKLREGQLENFLIFYARPDRKMPKESAVTLYEVVGNDSLKDVLTAALDVAIVVDKRREIYRIGNVKFHIDEVVSLGTFVEIEAKGEHSKDTKVLDEQCVSFMQLLGIEQADLVEASYGDMILSKMI